MFSQNLSHKIVNIVNTSKAIIHDLAQDYQELAEWIIEWLIF